MTYEQAVYFKLLLLCGYREELQVYLDSALENQEHLSNVVLELSFSGTDVKKILSVLDAYILQAKESFIDYDDAVFHMVLSFLREKYNDHSLSMKELADLMYQISLNTERYLNDPWHTMYHMGDCFSEAEAGYYDMNDYLRKLNAFITEGNCFFDYSPVIPKESFIKKLMRKLKINR